MKDTELNDGGPAFPHPEFSTKIHNGIRVYEPHAGMSLRDWFAGMALQGRAHRFDHPHQHRELLARDCYEIADAMLAERNRKEAAK